MRPCNIDWRLTTDAVKTTGMHTYRGWGIFDSITHQGQIKPIEFSSNPDVNLRLEWSNFSLTDQWARITSAIGEPVMKFLRPTEPSLEYTTVIWYSYGSYYQLEIRIDQWLTEEDMT